MCFTIYTRPVYRDFDSNRYRVENSMKIIQTRLSPDVLEVFFYRRIGREIKSVQLVTYTIQYIAIKITRRRSRL